jgi:hypothetical protein
MGKPTLRRLSTSCAGSRSAVRWPLIVLGLTAPRRRGFVSGWLRPAIARAATGFRTWGNPRRTAKPRWRQRGKKRRTKSATWVCGTCRSRKVINYHNGGLRREVTVELVTQLSEMLKCKDGVDRTKLHRPQSKDRWTRQRPVANRIQNDRRGAHVSVRTWHRLAACPASSNEIS